MEEQNWIEVWHNRSPESQQDQQQKLFNFKRIPKVELDQVALQSSHTAEQQIDCLQCANCCKSTVTSFRDEDITKAAKYLGMSRKTFIKKFLIYDGVEHVTITTPCPMLEADNSCKIYEARPFACQSFPHTSREHFHKRINAHKSNLKVCPITWATVTLIDKATKGLQK